MNYKITATQSGVKTYPLHKHNNYEVMLYIQGNGCLRTQNTDYPFSPGSIIIVPPGTEHGSTSDNEFKNISVCGEFENLFHFENVVTMIDNQQNEAKALAEIIYNNRFKNEGYISKLCSAYAYFILQNRNIESPIVASVNKITEEITGHFCDYNINLCGILQKSGYAEDYIRAQFKNITGKTPNSFLTDIRIKHAVFLIDIYKSTLSLQQISEMCGYVDYVYFQRRFKEIKGMSPKEYRASL